MKFWFIFAIVAAHTAVAAERMIAYGYTNCVACHVNPQGRNLLTEYGNSVDEAQSLRAGEYNVGMNLPAPNGINHIVRGSLSQSVTRRDGSANLAAAFHYLNYQNSSRLANYVELAFGVDFREPNQGPAAVTTYYSSPARSVWFLDYAFLKYLASDNSAIVAGKDQLPTGVNNSDSAALFHSRNALNNNERPIQLKGFWWTQTSMLSAYLYAPNGDEPQGQKERGAGLLAETDVLNSRTVLGINGLYGGSENLERQLLALYCRIGITGKTGVLAEVDQTWYSLSASKEAFRQQVSFIQFFYTPLEWVVWALTHEYLNVEAPYAEIINGYAGKLSLRLSRNFSIVASLSRSEKSGLITDVTGFSLFAKY